MTVYGPPEPGLNAHSIAWVDALDGAVVGTGQCGYGELEAQFLPPGRTRLQIPVETHLILRADFRPWCVIEGEVVARQPGTIAASPATISADGEDELTITGIPDGARLRASGAVTLPWTVITGGSAIITSSVAGRIVLEIECPAPWQDWNGIFHAV